jgi:carboxymethylenebutenolidase
MIASTVEIRTADGVMPTFVAHPDEGGPHPVVLIYMDALGLREELRDIARRIAAVGYVAMLPDLYYRWGCPSFDPAPLAQGILDPKMMELNGKLSMAMTARDTLAMLGHARSMADARLPAGAVGYCMGGRHALGAAACAPQSVAAYASLHGGRLVTDLPDSPHLAIARAPAEVYFGWADDDPTAPATHMQAVESALAARGGRWRVELHRGALHGFTFPERYCYDKNAAERVWVRLFSLFARNLSRA